MKTPFTPLQAQTISVPLAGKLDESMNGKILQPGQIAYAKNIVYDKTGLASVASFPESVSVYPYDSTYNHLLPNGATSHNNGTSIAVNGYITDSGGTNTVTPYLHQWMNLAYNSSPSPTAPREPYGMGYGFPIDLYKHRISQSDAKVTEVDGCYYNKLGKNHYVLVWVTTENGQSCIKYQVIEKDSETVVQKATDIVTPNASDIFSHPKIFTLNGAIHVYWIKDDGSSRELQGAVLSVVHWGLLVAATTIATLWTGLNPDVSYDAVYRETDNQMYLMTVNSTDSTIRGYIVNEYMSSVISKGFGYGIANTIGCTLVTLGTVENIFAAYNAHGGSNYYLYVVRWDLSTGFITNALLNTATGTDYSQIAIKLDITDTDNKLRIWAQRIPNIESYTIDAVTLTGVVTDYELTNACIASKPFLYNNQTAILPVTMDSGSILYPQYGAFLVTWVDTTSIGGSHAYVPVTVAHWLRGTGSVTASRHLSETQVMDTGDANVFLWPHLENTYTTYGRITINIDDYYKAIGYTTIQWHQEAMCTTSLPTGNTLVTNQGVTGYLGDIHQEAAPLKNPAIISLAPNSYTNLDAGEYMYTATYEWQDASGNLHISGPATPTSISWSTGQHGVTVTIETLSFGVSPWLLFYGIKIHIWRTNKNTDEYHHIGYVDNNPYASYVTFEDIYSTSDESDQAFLYTTGGILPNSPPPASNKSIYYNNRVWLIDKEAPNKVYYSKPIIDGHAPAWCWELQQEFPEQILSIEADSDMLYAFSANNVYVLQGEGLDNTGSGGFYPIRKLQPSIGLKDHRATLATPAGIIFQGASSQQNELYAINGGEIKLISDPVRDIVGNKLLINGTTDPEHNRIILSFDGELNNLVYDYNHNLWSYVTGPFSSGSFFFRHRGYIYASVLDLATDDWLGIYNTASPSYYGSATITTPWIRLSALTGFQRIWWINILGTWLSAHNAQIDLYYDYDNSAPVQTVYPGFLTSPPNPEDYMVRIKPRKQKCKAIKLVLHYSKSGGGPMVSLDTVDLVCGFKGGKARSWSTSK